MCDQLSTVGLEFDLERLTKVFMEGLQYSAEHPFPFVPISTVDKLLHRQGKPVPWANPDIFPGSEEEMADVVREVADVAPISLSADQRATDPRELWPTARPWALGQTRAPTSALQVALGSTVRRPGLSTRADEQTNLNTGRPLLATNERVHASVRVRLACGGLELDDRATWTCAPLRSAPADATQPLWRLERGAGLDPAEEAVVAFELRLGDESDGRLYPVRPEDGQWRWVYAQPVVASGEGDKQIPQATVLPEEPLVGYWERYLLALTVGEQDVWRYAEDHPPLDM
jgi:hypothetical protein